MSLPDDVLRSLEIVQIAICQDEYWNHADTTHDLSSLVLFLSKRPIHTWCFFLTEDLYITQFDEETLKIFCTMKNLCEIVWMTAQPPKGFQFKPIHFNFPNQCFPKLSKVEISAGPFDLYSLSSFFHSCPSLNHLHLYSEKREDFDSWRKLLPVICKFIRD